MDEGKFESDHLFNFILYNKMGDSLMNNEKFIEKWNKDRQKGKGWYMIKTGIVLGIAVWGGTAVGILMKGNTLQFDPSSFIGGFIGGLIGSRYRWNKNEEKYNDLI